MSGSNKHSAGNGMQGPAKRARKTQFKMCPVDIPMRPGTKEVQKDTQSFQVYDLQDGRLGMRREDGKVTLQVSEPPPSGPAPVSDGSTISCVLGDFHPDVAESGATAPMKKLRKPRNELRAAVRP